MAKPCPVVDVELPKKILAGYAMLLREREREKKKIQCPSYGVEWLYKVLRSSGPGSPVFVGINVRLLFRSYGLFFGNEYSFLKRFLKVTNILVLRDSPCSLCG